MVMVLLVDLAWWVFVINVFWSGRVFANSIMAPFSCPGDNEAWSIVSEDAMISGQRIQNWLYNRQHQCDITRYHDQPHNSGIGSTINRAVAHFIQALELGQRYRPQFEWFYSPINATSECSTKKPFVDCFHLPLSHCDTPIERKDKVLTMPAQSFDYFDLPGPRSFCDICRSFNKPALWLYGQATKYLLRLPATTQESVDLKLTQFLKFHQEVSSKRRSSDSSSSSLKCLSAGIHVRAGAPDGHRNPFDGTAHLAALREMNGWLLKEGKAICTVFVAGDHLETSVFASRFGEWGKKPVKGRQPISLEEDGMVLYFIPRYNTGVSELELFWDELKKSGNTEFTIKDLYVEYITDLHILSSLDVYVGAHSNVFALVDAMRTVYRPDARSDLTCYLDSRRRTRVCRNMGEMRSFWHDSFFAGFGRMPLYFD